MCRAGLPDRLVRLSLTLYFMNISPYELREYVKKDYIELREYKNKDYDEEGELQKMPTPLCPFLTQNYVEDPVEFYFCPYVKGTITKLAKEQVYFTNKDLLQDVLETKLRPLEEMVPLIVPLTAVLPMYEQNKMNKFAYYFGKNKSKTHYRRDVQDEGNDADKITLRSELMIGVFKPFFPQCRKIRREEFSVTMMHEFWA